MRKFPFYRQQDAMDCGPTCIKMISAYYGKEISLQDLRNRASISREGVSIKGIINAGESLGFRVAAIQVPATNDSEEISLSKAPLPCIVHWNSGHFVVVYKYKNNKFWIADPANGKHKIKTEEFKRFFEVDNGNGTIVLFEPTNHFYKGDYEEEPKLNFRYLLGYFRPYKKFLFQLSIAIVVTILLQLTFPFLTQSIVDTGIANSNLNFIVLILGAQIMLFLFGVAVNIMQRWILIQMNTRISVQLIHDFLFKLMKLPVHIFDSKHIGDLYQRIQDNVRVENFLSTSLIPLILGVINFFVFGIILFYYNSLAFIIYMVGLLAYISWIVLFLKKRKTIDYIRFQEASNNQNSILEMLRGMHEIKLQNSEQKRRGIWLNVQTKLFKANVNSLIISNYQDFGGGAINRLKDILIIFVCARDVITGEMTLGMLLAVQYIIGQMNVPLQQLIGIFQSAQDASLSLSRMNEMYNLDPEVENNHNDVSVIPELIDINIQNVSFKYNDLSELVLKDVSFTIPAGKTTAIVGTSGSGKTTLIKLMLGFYKPSKGKITIGDVDLNQINLNQWRGKSGVVMQESFLFSDTIANNITESSDFIDKEKLLNAVRIANIQEFIESQPLGYNTMIGSTGVGISRGQRQRLLIARAVYKDPDILFFDEATNALDAKNELIIVNNLNLVTKDKTVLVVAHRLSTVKNADQIIVLEKGKLIEKGNHSELVLKKGAYYELVKNQLELGN